LRPNAFDMGVFRIINLPRQLPSHRSMKGTHIVSLIFGSVVLLVTLASAQGQTPGTQNAALEQKIEDLKGDIEFIGEGEGLISPLDQLGSAYRILGNYDEAAEAYRRALKLSEEVHGRLHTQVAFSLNELASVLYEQAKYAAAEAMSWRSLALAKRPVGAEHRLVVDCSGVLGKVLSGQGKYAEADQHFERALAICEK